MSGDVYIIGTGMIKFGKYLERGIKGLTGEALRLALADCGLEMRDIEAAWFSNSGWGYHSFQHSIRGQVALSANGLDGLPIVNVENACASASTALHCAWGMIEAGAYDPVLAIGAEKMYDNDRAKTMMMFMSGADVEELASFMEKFQEEERKRKEREAREKGLEPPREKPGGHSAFMDLYAIGTRRHMELYGTTQRRAHYQRPSHRRLGPGPDPRACSPAQGRGSNGYPHSRKGMTRQARKRVPYTRYRLKDDPGAGVVLCRIFFAPPETDPGPLP